MLPLLILLVGVLVIGYFLGRGKTGERLENWFKGLRAPSRRNHRKLKLKVMKKHKM